MPPTPTSLMGLPASWRLKLATRKTPSEERNSVASLFRTCAFFRGTVLQHRTAVAEFRVPITVERFPVQVAKLCAVARRSSSVKLVFTGPVGGNGTGTEPHITHLLVCAMAELGGPLACVKEVHTLRLQQTALVPAWLKVCCPGVTSLKVEGTLTPHPLDLALALPVAPAGPGSSTQPSAGGGPRPLACQHLQSVHMGVSRCADNERWRKSIRQQLAALPSLSVLSASSEEWLLEPALVSTTVTSLTVPYPDDTRLLYHLAVQFPNLRQLESGDLTVDDDAVAALLHLEHLEALTVRGFSLHRSHAHRAWAVRHLGVMDLDVGALARLPLDGVQACVVRSHGCVTASGDVLAVARVAEAVRRWGGLGKGRGGLLEVSCEDAAVLLTTLGPLLAALPAAQRREVRVDLGPQDVEQATLQALGPQLPASVATLRLSGDCLQPEAWLAVLPSLPATVTELRLDFDPPPSDYQLAAMCSAAVRRIKVVACGVPAETRTRVDMRLLELGVEPRVVWGQWCSERADRELHELEAGLLAVG